MEKATINKMDITNIFQFHIGHVDPKFFVQIYFLFCPYKKLKKN